MGAIVQESSPANRFWSKVHNESLFAIYSPFVVCLASGTLELEVFRSFIAQGLHLLRSFVNAYEMAEECADDDDAKASIHESIKRVSKEITAYNHFTKKARRIKERNIVLVRNQEWSVDLVKESVTSARNKYIEFLLATATGKMEAGKGPSKMATPFEKTKIASYTVGAIAPWMRLYAFMIGELQKVLDHEPNHPYGAWFKHCASEGFQTLAQQTEELLDKVSVSLTGEELEVIEKLYHRAMKLEIEFLNMLPMSQKSLIPFSKIHDPEAHCLFIFSDFDLTCTMVDSSAVLAEITILTASKKEKNEPESSTSSKSSANLRKSFAALAKQYTEEYEQCVDNIAVKESGTAGPLTHQNLYTVLEQVAEFEKSANSRVIESEVLKGLNSQDIKRAGEHMTLQDGCTHFFQHAAKMKDPLNLDIHILSYCWCEDLIRSTFSSRDLEVMNIHSNLLLYEGSVCTGEILRKVESPIDKVHVFKNILANCSTDKHLSVYIGGSVGDLLCLLEADVGIVVGNGPSLRRLGNIFGVSFVPLLSGVVSRQVPLHLEIGDKQAADGDLAGWKKQKGVLYTVSSWTEIHAFLLGL